MAAVALALAVAGCGRASGPPALYCTAAGCAHSVTVTVDQPGERPLEACVGAVCSQPGADNPTLDVPLGDVVEVVVRVAGGGSEVARVTVKPVRSRPNGPRCTPECRSVRLRLTENGRLVPA